MPADAVQLYRITHRRYAETPFSGEGGLYYNSRWATKGQRVSYAADHLALATLEKIAGVQRVDLLTEMVYVQAEIPASHVVALADSELPDDWTALPAQEGTRALGDAWLAERRSVLLRVPSVVLPHSYNYVVNAAHPDARKLKIVDTEPLLLDNRVLRLLGIGAGSP
jgi:RES domain-containing protein